MRASSICPSVQESVGQTALGIDRVLGLQVERRAVGGHGILGALQLVVAGRQRELHASGAVVFGNCGERLGGTLEVALLAVEPRHVKDDLFRAAVDLLRGFELGLGLGGIVVQAVELAKQEMRLDIVRLKLRELLVFCDRELEHLAGLLGLHVAEGAEIDLAEQRVRLDIVRVLG